MKRSRASKKKYIESSDSEDDRPLKKTPPSHEKNTKDTDSSSESDIENYAWKPSKLDLDSEFFNSKKSNVPNFDNIEKNIFSGITRLSDSDSESTNDEKEHTEVKEENKIVPEIVLPHIDSSTEKAFQQLQEYTTKIEEAKRFVEIYKAKKEAEENKVDVQQLLEAGESSNLMKYNITPADLHSSDFESCESDRDDWQEIKNKAVREKDKQLIPKKTIQIVVDMPDTVKKKKGIDIIAAMKRRLNRIRKENQMLVHKVHLLCWIAHGNYLNDVLNRTEVLAMALSLMPSEQSYPSDRPDLSYLEQIVKWYKRTINIKEKAVPNDIPLEKCLHIQMNQKQAYNKKMLGCIFVAIIRSLGIPCRIVMSLQIEPLRPPTSELHSLSTKDQTKKPEKKEALDESKKASSSGLNKSTKELQDNKKNTADTTKSRMKLLKVETEVSKLDKKRSKSTEKPKSSDKLNAPDTRKRARSAESQNLKKKTQQKKVDEIQSQNESNEISIAVPKRGRTSKIKSPIVKKQNETITIPRTRRSKTSTGKESNVATKKEDLSEKSMPKKERYTKNPSNSVSNEDLAKQADKSSIGRHTRNLKVNNDKKSEEQTKLTVPKTKRRTKSAESTPSKLCVKNKARSKSSQKSKSKQTVPQVDGTWMDSDSGEEDFHILQLDGVNDAKKTNSKPNLKALKKSPAPVKASSSKKRRESVESETEFQPAHYYSGHSQNHSILQKPNLKKLGSSKPQQVDVTKDIVKLIKGRITEQKHIDRSKMAKKRKSVPASDSDSDYAPEPIKKKHHDSDDEFSPPKIKVKRRVQIPGKEPEPEKVKKVGNDVWVEVFLEAEEKWISVDLVHGQVHCVKELCRRATHPISYVLGWDNNNNLKDITQRYCPNFNTITRKQRVSQKWWNESISPFMALPTARDKEEDDDLARQQMDQPLPKSIGEYKNHPLYALKRHLLKFEGIYPPEPPTLGFIRGEAVYPRSCVYVMHSRDIWLKQAKVVKLGEKPYKIVKARPKYDKLSNKVITDQLLEIFGPWQVQDYEPPTAENGIVPKNAFGNVDLFKPCMIPKGTVHLKLPGLNKVARKLNIDCPSAIVGFDFHGGWSHPVYDGFVVCEEFKDQLILAWDIEQDELDRKEQEKIEKRVYGNWKRLIKGLLIRERLKAKYDFGEPSTSGTKEKVKKNKAPTFCTKKH